MPRKRLFPPPKHPRTEKLLQNKGSEDHSILTINGRIALSRRRYSAAGADSCHPLDEWVDQTTGTISLGVREMASRLNLASGNFDKSADNLNRAAQIRMSGELLRQVVESEGKALEIAVKSGTVPVGWEAKDCPALDKDEQPTQKTRIYLGSDGVMVPLITDAEKQIRRVRIKAKRQRRGRRSRPLRRSKVGSDLPYKEFKIVTFYNDTCEHRLVSVTRGDCEQAGRLMRRDASRVGLDKADDKVGVVDGSEWIKNQIQRQSLPLDDLGLDFYHLSENAHKARRAVFGEEDPKDKTAPGNIWVSELLHAAKHEGYSALHKRLVDWKGQLCPAKRDAAERLLNYVEDRCQMIQYPKFLEQGRQIGSGPTESMCKATTMRIKGVGRRWDSDNAQAIMSMAALDQSSNWQRYWDSRHAPAK